LSNPNDCDPSAWEPGFAVLDPEIAMGPEGMWAVMEAECAIVAYCHTKKAAEYLAEALYREYERREALLPEPPRGEGPFVSPEEFVKIAAETMKPMIENAFNRHAIFAGLGLRRDKK
jgi:hypothetical protein